MFQLTVGIIQAAELPDMDVGGGSDPYVKVRGVLLTFEVVLKKKRRAPF